MSMFRVPPFVSESCCNGAPPFDGREGDDHDTFASLALELQPLSTHLRNQLTAFAAGFAAVGGTTVGRCRANHCEQGLWLNEIENDY